VGGEIVRRNAGDDDGVPVGVQLEQVAPRPDVAAVVGDEDGQVADQPDAEPRGGGAQFRPLALEEELEDFLAANLAGEPAARRGERARLPPRQRRRPLDPGASALLRLQRREQRVVRQPAGVPAAEGRETALPRGRRGGEPIRRRAQPRPARGQNRAEVHPRRVRFRETAQISGGQPAVAAQVVEADQQRVGGEGRKALVGRVAVTGGAQRQELPIPLAHRRERAQPAARVRADLADAPRPRQRGRVQQQPGGAFRQQRAAGALSPHARGP